MGNEELQSKLDQTLHLFQQLEKTLHSLPTVESVRAVQKKVEETWTIPKWAIATLAFVLTVIIGPGTAWLGYIHVSVQRNNDARIEFLQHQRERGLHHYMRQDFQDLKRRVEKLEAKP